MKPVLMFASVLSILAANSAFALPHRPDGRTERPSAGQYTFGCGAPEYECEEQSKRDVERLCQKNGFSSGELLSAVISGAPTQQCYNPPASFPYCMTFTPYTVIYRCN